MGTEDLKDRERCGGEDGEQHGHGDRHRWQVDGSDGARWTPGDGVGDLPIRSMNVVCVRGRQRIPFGDEPRSRLGDPGTVLSGRVVWFGWALHQ
jgi:hypothetical protein